MPLRTRLRPTKGAPEPELVPTPVCDFCGDPIANVGDGVWLLAPERYDVTDTPVLFAHHDRRDDQGDPVMRCHTKYEGRERAAGRDAPGWLELGQLITQMILWFPGARARAAEALDLHERDVWLLRWLAAGMPEDPLPGQPKSWYFQRADATLLADRVVASIARGTGTSDTDDDVRYGQFGRDLRDRLEDSGPESEDDNPF